MEAHCNSPQKSAYEKKIEQQTRILLNSIDKILTRMISVEDPVIRYTLLVDKFLLITDVLDGYIETLLDDVIDPHTKEKYSQVMTKLNSELSNLSRWIQNPVYSPDHPFGNKLMKKCDFTLPDTEV